MTLEEAYKEGHVEGNGYPDGADYCFELSETKKHIDSLQKLATNNPIYIDDLNTSIIGMGAL